ncbi:MAG: hypothetical protein KH133_04360, partial [Acidaminococcus intestini]|uniref:hypothetical protein n=1 Tax=Acidaminococcus intestini TaxID=187327 RepID=UPI002431B445
DLIVRVDAVYVHFFMQKWGEERIFPHPNIYYRTEKSLPSPILLKFPRQGRHLMISRSQHPRQDSFKGPKGIVPV